MKPTLSFLVIFTALASAAADDHTVDPGPNILFILTDDHRHDCLSSAGNRLAKTPNLDRLAARGTRFSNAFVTLAICSPSRAACLTGQYGSTNGVTAVGNVQLKAPELTFANALRNAGYSTGVTGKWHLKTKPDEAGFDFASVCWANGTWYDRKFEIDGEKKVMAGFVDDVTADESIRFMEQAVSEREPFVLWMNTQVPHMDTRHTWPAEERFLTRYDAEAMPLPESWNDDLEGKPEYLRTARNRTRALEYGYDDPRRIREHARDYYASVEQMDRSVGRVLDELEHLGIRENTWVLMMGDNGWFLGEHGMTSKVLPYEESMRVPMMIAGPSTKAQVVDELALNIDLTATIYDLAGLKIPKSVHGQSLLPLAMGRSRDDWRTSFLYEAPTPQLGSQPLWAVRDENWKYVCTKVSDQPNVLEELYDLRSDASELRNLAGNPKQSDTVERLRAALKQHKATVLASAPQNESDQRQIPDSPPEPPRSDLLISGVYPHLTTYGVYSQNGAHFKPNHNECGIGAIVPWAGKLWMVNYAPHMPKGSEHKLYSVDSDLSMPIMVHRESVGGTPAGRMIHQESNQLLIGHHLIDAEGNVRTIQPSVMPMRVTAITRHLKDPENMVYYIDMEGAIWEANVHTLEVNRLFKKPVPGWHGKGGYVSQGRLVVSNNGEHRVGDYKDLKAGGEAKTEEERGVLAEWDGQEWRIVERRQFTEVTGPTGIAGGSDGDDPIWTMGWDRRSVRLKLLENGQWHTYLLPKAAYCNDALHGWYTEWPRIREITDGRWMMDMHGMFFDFPKSFSVANTSGLRPIGSHLRYVPDFCAWNDQLVLATDETSIQGNPLAGQPQSNLWFGQYKDLKTWGPANGYGGPWIDDKVLANQWTDPFLVAGFAQRCLHLAVGRLKPLMENAKRCTDQQQINSMPDTLSKLPRVTVARGDWRQPAPGYSFTVDQPVTVFLAVDRRGDPKMDNSWQPTELEINWGNDHRDRIYKREIDAGSVVIPPNGTNHWNNSFGMPHLAFVQSRDADVQIMPDGRSTVTVPSEPVESLDTSPVTISAQIDVQGTNQWTDLDSFRLEHQESTSIVLPSDLDATWIRFRVDRNCVATAFLHQTSAYPNASADSKEIFNGLADVEDQQSISGLVYAAKRNRNLRIATADDHCYEFSKAQFEFTSDSRDDQLIELLRVEPEFTIDEASVIVEYQGQRYRLPKGHSAYDRPFTSGWPRALREVESERTIANIHGTFYEVPLVTNGAPPAWNLIRPISSHRKQISDFCSWNGLLVLSGIKSDARDDGHIFRDPKLGMGLWLGGVDDLWKFGKPVGVGGPWKNSVVHANVPSDPYLLTGYDKRAITVSHADSTKVRFRLEIDIDGNGRWIEYKTLDCPAGKEVSHEIPTGISACWIRTICDQDTTATVQLTYR